MQLKRVMEALATNHLHCRDLLRSAMGKILPNREESDGDGGVVEGEIAVISVTEE